MSITFVTQDFCLEASKASNQERSERELQRNSDAFQGRPVTWSSSEEIRMDNGQAMIQACEGYFVESFGCSTNDLIEKRLVELTEIINRYVISVETYRNISLKKGSATLEQISRMYPNCPNIIFRANDFNRGCPVPDEDIVINLKELMEKEQEGSLTLWETQVLSQDPFYGFNIFTSFVSRVKHANKELASLTEEEFSEISEDMAEFSQDLYELKKKNDQEAAAEEVIQADRQYQELLEECGSEPSPSTKSVGKRKKAKKAAKKGAQQEFKDAELPALSSQKVSKPAPKVALKVEKSALQITLVPISHPKFKSPVGMEWRVGMWAVIDLTNPETFALLPPSYQNLPLDQLRYQRDVHNIGDGMCRILSKEELVESHACSQMHRNTKGTLQMGLVFVARMVDSVGRGYVGKIHVAWYVNKKKKKVLYHVGFKPCQKLCFADLRQESEIPEMVVPGGAFNNVSKTALRADTDCGIKDVIILTIGRTSDDEVRFYIPPLEKGL